jgi:hypothetical protein
LWEPDPLLPEPDESSSSSVVGGDVDAEPLDTVDTVDCPPPLDPEPLRPDPDEWSSSSSSIVPDDGVVLRGRVVAGADRSSGAVVGTDPPSAVVGADSSVVVVDGGSVVLVVDGEVVGASAAGGGGF